eukprot:maker-scaffold196_size269943-snap-gene-1.31 protein:Tk08149 transcript:maker-scaffold196_size269943-snap-gene-1.31-mRNA-1 annotation:"PREDICTED: uncharacterized protein LOC100906479"
MDEIRSALQGHLLWISIDETTDATGRAVGNVLLGRLDHDTYHKPYLVNSAFLDKTNSSTIARLVNDSLRLVSPNFEAELAKVLVTDAAAYMLKAGTDLKVFFPSLLHVTCLAHALHRVCDTDVNSLFSSTKKVFLKAPSRLSAYKESYRDLPFPPEPGTWVEAASWYAEHLPAVQHVVSTFDPDEATCIRNSQAIMAKASLAVDLAFIQCHLSFLPNAIKRLEKAGLPLAEALAILDDAKLRIETIPGTKGQLLQQKITNVLRRNPGMEVLQEASKVLKGNGVILPEGMSQDDVSKMKFCPTTSVDVERSFSQYKNILSDRRHSFTKENI